jgi:hypothetical protein
MILDKFLKKIGVKSYEELNEEEKNTYKDWEASLQGRQITEEDYRRFLESELDTAVSRLTEVNLSKEDEVFRKVEVRLIKKIINFLDMPKVEKAILEKQIESRI